jgi:uncharacterized protein
MTRTDSRTSVVRQFFQLLNEKNIEAWGDLWHPSGRIIVFYQPEGFAPSIDGKEAIVAAFKDLIGIYESFQATLTGVYPAADSDAVCVEYSNRAALVTGGEYTNDNIAVFRFDGELISEYHDYFDPRRFQVVVDALATRG